MSRGDIFFLQCPKNKVTLAVWKDTKVVAIISTVPHVANQIDTCQRYTHGIFHCYYSNGCHFIYSWVKEGRGKKGAKGENQGGNKEEDDGDQEEDLGDSDDCLE